MNILSLFGRSQSIQQQLEEHRQRLYRLAYSWSHDHALADDLVQETLAKALRSTSQLRDEKLLRSWLFSILTNCWRDHFRSNREMEDIDELEDFHCVNHTTPADEHERNQVVRRVRGAVAQLPLGQRQVLTLVDLEECSYSEVAEILGIPVGTVMSRLCRARRALKGLLHELAPESRQTPSLLRRVK